MSLNIFSLDYKYRNIVKDCITIDDLEAIKRGGTSIDRGRTAGYGHLYLDSHFIRSESQSCMAGLNEIPEYKTPLKFIVVFCMTPSIDEERGKKYIHWLTNASPYAEAFVDKNPNTIWEKQFILTPHVPANVMVSAAIATRWLSESRNKGPIRIWNELVVKCKADPLYAFAFSHFYNVTNFDTLYPVFCSPNDNHNVLYFSKLNTKVVKNFVTNNKVGPTDTYFKLRGYKNLEALWGGREQSVGTVSTGAAGVYVKMGDIVKTFRPKIVTSVNYNPFEKYMLIKSKEQVARLQNISDLENVYNQFVKVMNDA
jgi:hypothetical protein